MTKNIEKIDIDATESVSETKKGVIKAQETLKKNISTLYIGPTLKNEMITHGAAFRGMPDVDTLEKKYPGVRAFFVKSNEIASSLKALKEEGTELNIRYKEIAKVVLEGGVK